jgi:allantoinase
MPIIAKYNLPLLVHCELSDNELRATGNPQSYKNYLQSRPKKWEDEAIALMIKLCGEYNCKVHIVHLSSANSIAPLDVAKQRSLPITVETGQHYLYFNAEDIPDGITALKCAPPIREMDNNDKLWQALKDGVIDFVATDHSPATPNLKEIESGNFMKAWGGIASIQFALPVLWTAAKKRNGTFSDIVKWLCENPAKLIGAANSKGKIAKGFDADIIILNDEQSFIVTAQIIHHKHKVTPYLNEELFGVVTHTFLAGEKVFEFGQSESIKKGKIILNQLKQLQ